MSNLEPGLISLDVQDRILAEVASGFSDQLAFLEEAVRCPSVRGSEQTVQDLMHDAMQARGYDVDRWKVNPDDIRHHEGFSNVAVSYENAWNVVGTHRPSQETGRSLILNGHIDVVPTGPLDMWETHPFDPVTKEGWMYGRGAGDMKAGVVSNLFALDAIRRAGYQPAGRVHLESVCEEESTGNGALATLVRGYSAEAALISEPTGLALGTSVLGVLWFQVQVRGLPVHVAHAGTGANAIEAAYQLIQALHGVEADWNSRKDTTKNHGGFDHPINLNIGKIEGGDWASSVPAWCNFDCRIAIFPGHKPEEMKRDIEAKLKAATQNIPFLANNPPELVWNGFFTEGYDLERGSEQEKLLETAHSRVTGQPMRDWVGTAYVDSRVFVLYADIPCLIYGPTAENIHGFNERVKLDSILEATQAIALFAANWCGLQEI